jgi:hypothetical protein
MMTEQEKQTSEKYRGFYTKIALTYLYEIYDKYNGSVNKGCWCSSSTRKQKAEEYYNWYDKINN